jgi:hypothetical protein
MKNGKLLIIIISLLPKIVSAQMSLPCLNYETQEQLEGFYGQMNTNCVTIDFGQWWGSVSDEHSRSFEVNEGVINPGTAESGGIVIQPGENVQSGFQMTLRQTNNAQEMEGAWFEPTTGYDVPLYEKVEWGVKLPQQVQTAIDNWISNDQNGTTLTPAINPFDPEQLDMYAEVWQPGATSYQPVFGFYYRDYRRIWRDNNPNNLPDMDDPDNWFWEELSTEYDFRLRWSPTIEGWHTVKIKLHVPNLGDWEVVSFNFRAVSNDPRQSFISVTSNKKYFQTNDGNIFFPVGQNVDCFELCRCENRSSQDPYGLVNSNCETCYAEGEDDYCCGLDKSRVSGWWQLPLTPIKDHVEPMATHLKMNRQLDLLKQSGANSFRTFLSTITYDFEFEKLNNYYERQFLAWEFDKLIEHSALIDIRIELVMLMHFQYTHTQSALWDWTDLDRYSQEGHGGNCYYTERDRTNCDIEPSSFFSSPEAKDFYKKKLRYFIARYGYSKQLIDLELASEINNTGARTGNPADTTDWFGWLQTQLPASESYKVDAQTRYNVGQWQIEMANFIKNDLKHYRHPIGACYTGAPMLSGNLGEDLSACENVNFDMAWNDDAIDVIAFSSYDVALDTWQKLADQEDPNKCQWMKMECPELSSDLIQDPNFFPIEVYDSQGNIIILDENLVQIGGTGIGPPYYDIDGQPANLSPPLVTIEQYQNGRQQVQKPAIHSETGPGSAGANDITWFEKDLWCNGFAGFASSGMTWVKQWYYSGWDNFGRVRQFFDEQVFPLGGFGTTNNWDVGYANGSGNSDNAIRLEAIYLINNEENNSKAVGILMNRCWNPASVAYTDYLSEFDLEVDTSEYNKWLYEIAAGIDGVHFADSSGFIEIASNNNNPPKIPITDNCDSYSIQYFNPYTLAEISTSDDDVILGNGIKLKDFPTLTIQLPYVLFKILRNGNCISNISENDSNGANINERDVTLSNGLLNNTEEIISDSQEPMEQATCVVIPNPATNIIYLNCAQAPHSVELYNTTGNALPMLLQSNGQLNISHLAAGIYYIRAIVQNQIVITKLIKLQ